MSVSGFDDRTVYRVCGRRTSVTFNAITVGNPVGQSPVLGGGGDAKI